MRLSGLCAATLFLLSSFLLTPWALAQHSNSSSGSSSSSSSGGGGGSHSSSSGGSSSSGSSGGGSHSSSSSSSSSGGHSSNSSSAGHSSSGGSSAHGTSARGSNSGSASAVSPARGFRSTESKTQSAIREPSGTLREPAVQPEKRGFFSFLRHPFHKPEPEPKPGADLRHRVCFTGPCPVCPPGARGGACGGGTVVLHNSRHTCSGSAIWSGASCVLQTHYLDDCSGLRSMMERQAQRMQAAESIQRSACAAGPSQECAETSSSFAGEQNLYRSLQQRYQQCRMQTGHSFPLRSFAGPNGSGQFFDPSRFDARY
jgi:hypothetical protein